MPVPQLNVYQSYPTRKLGVGLPRLPRRNPFFHPGVFPDRSTTVLFSPREPRFPRKLPKQASFFATFNHVLPGSLPRFCQSYYFSNSTFFFGFYRFLYLRGFRGALVLFGASTPPFGGYFRSKPRRRGAAAAAGVPAAAGKKHRRSRRCDPGAFPNLFPGG